MKRDFLLILLLAAAMSVLCACGSDDASSAGGISSASAPASSLSASSGQPEPLSLDLMYIPLGEAGAVYFDQADDSALTLRLPEDLRDENGEPIAREDLNRGDVLRLYFSQGYEIGETWPGQLFTEADYAQIIQRGKPEDADKYQNDVDAFYHPDPLRLPYLQFTHIDGMSARGGSLSAEEGSYAWDCTDENGEPVHLSREAGHPLLRQDISEIPMACAAPLELYLEGDVQSVEVRRWPASSRGDKSLPEGESVRFVYGSVSAEGVESLPAASNGPQRIVVEDAGPGYVYEVRGQWEQGFAAYAFFIYQDDGCGNRVTETLCAVMGPAGAVNFYEAETGRLPVDWRVGDLPDAVTDENGAPLDRNDVKTGDRLTVLLHKVRLSVAFPDTCWEAYAAQRLSSASLEDKALAEQYWRQNKPEEPPALILVNNLAVEAGAYQWHFTDRSGTVQGLSAEKNHPLLQGWMHDIKLPGQMELEFRPGYMADGCKACCWDEALRGTGESDGEELPISEKNGKYYIPAEPGKIYEITFYWEEDFVKYTFHTVEGALTL